MPGGAFCGCGRVEFTVPGIPIARTHRPKLNPNLKDGDSVVTLHRPGGCRLATEHELRNLDPTTPEGGAAPRSDAETPTKGGDREGA
jgi:hypothetical protein